VWGGQFDRHWRDYDSETVYYEPLFASSSSSSHRHRHRDPGGTDAAAGLARVVASGGRVTATTYAAASAVVGRSLAVEVLFLTTSPLHK